MDSRRRNKILMWVGVVVLVAILLLWIFGIGTAEDISGVTNG